MKISVFVAVTFQFVIWSMSLQAQPVQFAYVKEKLYVHTNHVFYQPGDVMYFKLYVVDGGTNLPTTQSTIVFTDIITPAGTVAKQLKLPVTDGYAVGSFDIEETAPGGVYTLKAYTNRMRNESDSTFFSKQITVQQFIAPRILMKLDFPQKGYGAGDEVIAELNVRSLDDLPLKYFNGKYTISLAGNQHGSADFITDMQGKAAIRFRLPGQLSSADGLLNVTLQNDGYTESISRSIPIVLHKIDVQFMPEGGTWVNGLANQMAFKATNEWGKPVDISGYITDKNEREVTRFESVKFGMGKFAFTPENGNYYTAHITSPANIASTFLLPVADNSGIVLNVEQQQQKLEITLKSTYEKQVRLSVQSKAVQHWTKLVLLKPGSNLVTADVPSLPPGIAQVTLYDMDDMPMAERLSFWNSDKRLQINMVPDKTQYQPREKVMLNITTTDEKGKAVPANLSMSVVDDKLWTMADDKQHHILSWLLLGTELKGKIEEPTFYFKKDEPKALPTLDLLMLTHGYRYFDFIPYVLNNQQLQYGSDLTNLVSGRVVDARGKPTKAKIYLVNPHAGTQAFFKETKADGEFLFTNLTPQASYMLIAQPVVAREKLSFEVSKSGMFQNPLADERLYKGSVADNMLAMATKRKQAFQAKTQTVEVPGAILAPVKSQSNLSEVVVVGYGSMKKKDLTGSVSFVSAKELQNGLNLSTALSGKASGLMIQSSANSGASPFIRIRGNATLSSNNKPLLVVNGVPQENLDANLQAENIENITVLRDATATALYGSRGSNGVIIVNEKRQRLTPLLSFKPKSKFSLATHYFFTAGTPFTVVRKFYAPVYEKTETDVRNDFRENIYWNPIVQTDDKGKASLQFYNNDASTTFRIVAEGIGYNGLPGNAEKTYASRAVVAADIKMPHNLTVGDKPQLPLNVKNNGTQAAEFEVQVSTIKGLSFLPFQDRIWLQPGEARELLLPAVALSKLQDSLRVTVIAAGGRQQLRVPITVAEKGFPIHITKAGNSSAKYPFTISEVIPGSMHATFKIFSSLEGQLLDGIESMLKEPYGCFEQTSSTTYPNVFILKYLKESGKSNAAIEQKARKYITAGYKRLVGFETSEDGFEWFGHAPAHEALTAYGLLEFTDMQEFVEVDKKMMDRTLNFLLKKRDGKGGFGVRKGGYDRFASVPASVANTYIVYAIARSGHGKAIPTEYEQAYLNALKTKDAYQLALMALSAHYMGLTSHSQQLLLELDNCYERKNLSAATSVVNSGGASLKVETRALYVQALLCQPQPNLAKAAILLNELMNEKSYYGYGSTQATVLALQAVVAFAKASSAYLKTQPTITATLNQQTFTDDVLPRDGTNIFEVAIDKAGGMPWQYQVDYFTHTPPSSDSTVVRLQTYLGKSTATVGQTVRLNIAVTNTQGSLQPMTVSKIGIPGGFSLQPWQLKELTEQKKLAYYEIFDNYLVLYWMGFEAGETKTVALDLKADIAGSYTARASNVYLYYTPEYKHWQAGLSIQINPAQQ